MKFLSFSNLQIETSSFNFLLFLGLYYASSVVFCQLENEIFPYDVTRIFNSQPYEALVQSQLKKEDPGPVLFPKTPGDDDPSINNKYNIVNIESIRMEQEERQRQQRQQLANQIHVNGLPFSQVADKVKFAVSGEYDSRENEVIDPEIYEELARNGVKILNVPRQNLGSVGVLPSDQKKPYQFFYKVSDGKTGDDFSHGQVQVAKDTLGEYRVKLPDGRVQIVSYVAGKNGFNADVKYLPNSNENTVDIKRVPVKELRPTARPLSYEYLANEELTIQEQQLVSPLKSHQGVVRGLEKIGGPTEIPVNYVDVTVTPTPASLSAATGISYLGPRLKPTISPVINYPKAVYTTNPKEQFLNYNAASVEPPVYFRKYTPVKYTTTPIPPTQPTRFVYKSEKPISIGHIHETPPSVRIQPLPVVHLTRQPIYTTVSPIGVSHVAQPHIADAQFEHRYPQPTYRPPVLNPKPQIINYGDHGLFNPTDPDYVRQREFQEQFSSGSTTKPTTLAPIVVADEEDAEILKNQPLEHSYKPLILRRRNNGIVGKKIKQLEGYYLIDKAQRDHIKK